MLLPVLHGYEHISITCGVLGSSLRCPECSLPELPSPCSLGSPRAVSGGGGGGASWPRHTERLPPHPRLRSGGCAPCPKSRGRCTRRSWRRSSKSGSCAPWRRGTRTRKVTGCCPLPPSPPLGKHGPEDSSHIAFTLSQPGGLRHKQAPTSPAHPSPCIHPPPAPTSWVQQLPAPVVRFPFHPSVSSLG